MDIIGTTRLNFELEKLITEADDFLIFLSPYLKIGERLRNLISAQIGTINNFFLLCREKDLSKSEARFIESHPKIKLINTPNLHAKCYLSESTIILASMNLYDFSQINNFELGVIITRKEEKEKYRDVLLEIDLMLNNKTENCKAIKEKLSQMIKFKFGELASKILKNYHVNKKATDDLDSQYKFISQEAMKIHPFDKSDLYQDKSAVLRNTKINKKEFNLLYKNITANLNRK